MKIGFCYDTKEDYGFESGNLDYTDFVSLTTIAEIETALERCGHDVISIGNVNALKMFLESGNDVDLYFNIAEGFGSRNREALIPALLEICKKPYTASDVYAMAIALQKHQTKELVKTIGVPVPDGFIFSKADDDILDKAEKLGWPVVLKPNAEGGSMGLRLIKSKSELIDEIDSLLSKSDGEWLIEEYIEGKEITVPIIGNADHAEALGVVATIHENGSDIELYDSELKYIDNVINTAEFSCPENVRREIAEYSVAIHRYFNLRDYSRMDFRLTSDYRPYFLEANLMPSLCRHGSFEVCGKSRGLEYHEIIGRIIDEAAIRNGILPLATS